MKNTLSVVDIKKTIIYLHLLHYLPLNKLEFFNDFLIQEVPERKGLPDIHLIEQCLPEACYRIVAFHQATREPDLKHVNSLLESAFFARKNTESLKSFKQRMDQVAILPGRAKPENRLHRNKGCRYCAVPCQYGFFTLVSDPDFTQLQRFFKLEITKPASRQTPLLPVYLFTIQHLMGLTDAKEGLYDRAHVANLAFCLLMMGMAKSRMAFPEPQTNLFQEANQAFIRQEGIPA